MLDFYKQRFAPGNMIISAAGNLKHEQFVELVAKHFEHMKPVKNGFHSSPPKIVPRIIMRNKKSLEQVQICVGVPSHPIAHENRHASYILNTLLGGGMSSRLFQNIRERQGLAYAIYSDLIPTATPDASRSMPEPRASRPAKWCSRWSRSSAS